MTINGVCDCQLAVVRTKLQLGSNSDSVSALDCVSVRYKVSFSGPISFIKYNSLILLLCYREIQFHSSKMAMSGVKLTEGCLVTYQDIQKSKKHRYAVFVIREGQIDVETVSIYLIKSKLVMTYILH